MGWGETEAIIMLLMKPSFLILEVQGTAGAGHRKCLTPAKYYPRIRLNYFETSAWWTVRDDGAG